MFELSAPEIKFAIDAARQAAMEQIPRGATVQRTECQPIQIGFGLPRWRCTVWYTDTPPASVPAAGSPTP